MQTKRLNLVDTAWLNVDTPNAPMQVGGLLTFKIPDDAPADFCQRLFDRWKTHARAERPWNQRLRGGRWRNMAPEWELLDEIDVDYHFRHSALPAPGGELELGTLTSRLHSHPIDLTRPPWECHLIEGLAGHRFALYLKIHHSLLDGVAGMKLLARALSQSADERERPPFWAVPPKKSSRAPDPDAQRPGLYRAVAELVGSASEQVSSLSGFAGILRDMLRTARSGTNGMGLPFAAPGSVLNGRITSNRRYATQLYSLTEFKALAAEAGVTINDIILTVCGTALQRYLDEIGELPSRDLTAGIPVSVRPADDEAEDDLGNAITFIIANLATTENETATRLKRIAESTRAAKQSLEKLSGAAITQYTVALMAPYILSLVSGMAGRTRPVFNVTVSNLPGPREDLFVEGARMEAFFPTSLVTHGQALNITIHGYADTLGFGFIGCRDSLPSLQHIAVYAGEAVDELRRLYGKPTDGPDTGADTGAAPAAAKAVASTRSTRSASSGKSAKSTQSTKSKKSAKSGGQTARGQTKTQAGRAKTATKRGTASKTSSGKKPSTAQDDDASSASS